ncbi:MAG: hypothetical protein WCN92_05525 [Eubacteriales bacterium]
MDFGLAYIIEKKNEEVQVRLKVEDSGKDVPESGFADDVAEIPAETNQTETPEDTENPKLGQEPAPAEETEETPADETTEDENMEEITEETEEAPVVGDGLSVPVEIEENAADETIAEQTADDVGQGFAPATEIEEPETNPTTASTVPLPLTREAKDEGSSDPEETEEALVGDVSSVPVEIDDNEIPADESTETTANAEEDNFIPELSEAMDAEDAQTEEPAADEIPNDEPDDETPADVSAEQSPAIPEKPAEK